MGKLLADENLTPDLIITSSAKRALATAQFAAQNCGYEQELMVTRELYHADPEDYRAVLREKGEPHACVMVVGHNPGMEELVAVLTDVERPLSTANVAVVELPIESWGELSLFSNGRLRHHWQPKDLPA